LIDWIDTFMAYSEGIPSPAIFRQWAAIGVVAGALERRCWTKAGRGVLYPNLFTLLVAPPAVGKSQAINLAMEIVYASKKGLAVGESMHISPDSVTRASLVDALSDASKKVLRPTGGMLEYHSLFVAAGELGVLLPAHDLEFLSVLNSIFDNGRVHREKRRGNNLDKEILNPQINILAGSQPGFLGSMLPEEAWSMGFTSRLMMIYAAVSPYVPLFKEQEPRVEMENTLVKELKKIYKCFGNIAWEPDAEDAAEEWVKNGCPPEVSHSKLQHYAGRRKLMMLKLSMVAAVSRGQTMTIAMEDFLRAKSWLLDAEAVMPDIFRDMAGRSDHQVLQELHFYMWQTYTTGGKKPLHEARLLNFLSARIPSEKIKYVIDIAIRSGMMTKTDSGLYTPRPKHEHGEE